jgi:Tol biopolymer transport system component/DNA-binding winged helix-turn-helix (wHTH) protein
VAETSIFRFEDVEVRPGERVLLKAGIPVAIEPKTFRVLIYLMRNPGRLVTKEELLNAVWEDTSVSENSLTRSIAALRRLLGDDAREPRFIATAHTAGYRFVCPVEVLGENGTNAPPLTKSEMQVGREKPTTGRRWRAGWFVMSGAVAIVYAVLVWIGARISHTQNPGIRSAVRYRVVPVTSLRGAMGNPVISPDGKQVAFFWVPEGGDPGHVREKSGLYVQLVGGGQPLQLAHSKLGFFGHAAWSPDGRQIAYGRCDDDGGGIYAVFGLGGPEHKVTDVICMFGDAGYPTWTSDGKAMVIIDRCGATPARGVVVFSLETGQKRCISNPSGNATDLNPVLSPDGQTVAFIRMVSWTVADIYTVPLAGGAPRRLTNENKHVWQLMWSPDGRSIIFLSGEAGLDGLRRVPAQGGSIEVEREYPGVGSMSVDGSRLVYQEPQWFWASSATIWRADLPGAGDPIKSTRPIAQSNTLDGGPQISPDGKTVVFESIRSGAQEIWKCNPDGSDAVQLTSLGGHSGTPRWSPDGKWIVFDLRQQEHSQIWMMNQDGRNVHAIISGSYENIVPNWTKDGKTLLFASTRTGQYQVWARDFKTGQERQITKAGGFASYESPDGKSLLFTKLDGAGVWSLPRSGGPEVRILEAPHVGDWGQVAVTEQGIYFMDSDAADGPTINYFAFQTKSIRKVFTFASDKSSVPWAANLGASRDGRIVYFVQGMTKSSIVMAELRR